MTDYIPPAPSGRDEVIARVTRGYWKPSEYGDGLVLTDQAETHDGVLGTGDDGGTVYQYIDGASYDTGVAVTLAAAPPEEERLSGHEDITVVTASVS